MKKVGFILRDIGGVGLELTEVEFINFIDSFFRTAISDEECIEDFKIHSICTELIIGTSNKSVIANFQTSFKIEFLLIGFNGKAFASCIQLNEFRLNTNKRDQTIC